jgi:FAD binding domain
MISDRFRDRRVFWCGDAAHIWVPFAGYETNAGIADAIHLSWKLAGALNGWAEAAILDASELERQPVNEQVSRYAMNTSFTRKSLGSPIPHNLKELGPEGEAVRAHSGKSAYEQNVGQFCCAGQLPIFLQEFSDYRVRRRGSPQDTIYDSSSPQFRAAARRMYGCAVGRSL